MIAGLAGLFGAVAFVAVLPVVLLCLVGWWIGKRIAFLTLTARDAMVSLSMIGLIPFLFWYPSIGIFIKPGSERFSSDLLGHVAAYWKGLMFSFFPAGISAAISWILNLDDYQSNKRKEPPE